VNSLRKYRRADRQRGAAMVEMAIVVTVFLALVFGIIEFALVIFHWSKMVESTRAGARYAIVNDPACDIYGLEDINQYDCVGGPLDCAANPEDVRTVEVDGDCTVGEPYNLKNGDAGCSIVERMRAIQPLIGAEDTKVIVTYACTDVGFAGLAQKVPTVKIETSGVPYKLIVPSLFGLEALSEVTMPSFATTRTGEDLDTVN
jgi:hypothetical protein